MMAWFTVLKMPNPFGDNWQTLTSSEYYKMDEKNKQDYHSSMASFYNHQIKIAVIPRKAGQAPPATDDQIRGLRELSRFHQRQSLRIRRKMKKENYYSLEEEENRLLVRPQYDAVERMPHTTKEMYDNYSRDEKLKYWNRLKNQLRVVYGMTHPKISLAIRMAKRMQRSPNYTPPFEGEELSQQDYTDKYRNRDVSEYNNFTDDEKRKYHSRMWKRSSDDLRRFHDRMRGRIRINSSLPTYPTPEAQKEAEEE